MVWLTRSTPPLVYGWYELVAILLMPRRSWRARESRVTGHPQRGIYRSTMMSVVPEAVNWASVVA